MNITTIAEAAGAMVVALGGFESVKWAINTWIHRKANSRIKTAEADKAESEAIESSVSAEKSIRDMYEETLGDMRKEFTTRINDLHSSLSEANRFNTELIKIQAQLNDTIEDKTTKIRELNEARVTDARKIGTLEKELLYYRSWKCFREVGRGGEKCNRRKPAQNPPLKYEPIEEVTSE
jgi:predicted RNase H-like nuclease (RuvC/YqgF family)